MTGTDDLIAFVRRCLDDDERVAREASRPWFDRGYTEGGEHWRWEETEHDQVLMLDPVVDEYLYDGGRVALRSVEEYPTGNPWTLSHHVVTAEEVRTVDAMHIARWDPARVLAEVDAKRRILDEYVRWDEDDDLNWDNARDAATMASALLVAVKALAQPYSGQPGWREEWTA